jgi:DNA (cytosine-5)-methyltransferase 3A
MNILSAFGGMECGKVALDRANIKYDRYYSSEIDKYAIKIANKNHPDIIQLGDIQFVTGQQFVEVGGIDLLIGGSPCQGFSFAGKQLNFDDPRSALFFEFVRLKRELSPKWFLLENVKMKKDFQNIISKYLGVEPIEINSALVSAQNRKRLYWTNIPDIEQPNDKGILLKDILEGDVDDKYYLKNPKPNIRLENNLKDINGKSNCFLSTSYKGAWANGTTLVKINKKGNIKRFQDKASTLSGGAHSGGNHSDMDLLCIAQRGRYNKDGTTSQNLEPRFDSKTNSLTTVQKDNMIFQLNPSKESGGKQPYQQNRIYDTNGIMPALNAQLGGRNNIYKDYKIRRLTPIECERLQTLPDNYTEGVSDTQRYKMLGNGWTVDVIVDIFKNIPQ